MRELYNTINDIIDKIDFTVIWRGFAKYPFALYDKDNVYFPNDVIPRDNRFLGNTSIEYNGEFIAIWNVDDPLNEDPEILAAELVHEMFHAFQRKNREARFPDDLILLNYPDNEENYLIKYNENMFLSQAFTTAAVNEKKNLLQQFISARKYRESLIGDIILQEYFSETIEGMAEYAGCMALKQISRDKYDKRINSYIENLQKLDGRIFDTRRLSYYSGALLCISLNDAEIDFHHAINGTEAPLFTIISRNAAGIKPVIEVDLTVLQQEFRKNADYKARMFSDLLSSHHDKTEGNFTIY